MRRSLHSFLALILTIVLAGFTVKAEESADSAGTQIVEKYLNTMQVQQDALRGISQEVEINAQLPKLHEVGNMKALRMISKVGKISYKMMGFSGANRIKNDVIARYLTAETEGQKDLSSMAITPANYKFKYKGLRDTSGQQVYVFDLKPKENRVGLFKGELWLDAKTYMPVQETGRFVKNPSVFLKKVEFVRNYEIVDGVAVPKHIQSTVETRVVGKAEIAIDFTNMKKLDAETAPVEEARSGQ